MPKFRKKPVEIEARQVPDPRGSEAVAQVFSDAAKWCGGETTECAVDGWCILIETLEGTMKALPGDWIIKEPFATDDRQFYPCKPDIFAATYERVAA